MHGLRGGSWLEHLETLARLGSRQISSCSSSQLLRTSLCTDSGCSLRKYLACSLRSLDGRQPFASTGSISRTKGARTQFVVVLAPPGSFCLNVCRDTEISSCALAD